MNQFCQKKLVSTRNRRLYFILAFFASEISFGQTTTLFQITEGMVTERLRSEVDDFKKKKLAFYEDEKYLVSKTCSGEWGGTVKFKNKKTGVEYACSATCPVSVNKINGKYFVTSSLAHLSGFTEILEISNPDSMEVVQKPLPEKRQIVSGEESSSTKGAIVVIDSIGVLALGSFIFEAELFHVVTDFKKTYIASISNGKFRVIDHITNERTWTYEGEIVKDGDNRLIIPIFGGYLDILDNQVRLLKYR